jgi:hypothetical protein
MGMTIRDFDDLELQGASQGKRQFGPVVLSRDGDHQAVIKTAKVINPPGKPASLLVVFDLQSGEQVSKFFAINSQSEKGQKYALRMQNSLANSVGFIKCPDDPALLVGKNLTIRAKTGPWFKDQSQESTEIIAFSPPKVAPVPPTHAAGKALDEMPF